MSLILIKPKILTFKNSFVHRSLFSAHNMRDIIILSLAISVMYLIYKGTLWAITQINANPSLLYLSPSYPLGMILALLLFMLFISGIAVSIGSLFLAQDLDLILATPLSKRKIFSSKLFYIIANSSWMPLIFIIPLLIAFGQAYKAPPSYYLFSSLTLIPYFTIAGSFSLIIAIIMNKLLPAARSREVLLMVVVSCLILIFMLIDLVRLGFAGAHDHSTIARLVTFLSLANLTWLPSNWAAICMQDFILSRSINWPIYLPLLLFGALATASLAHIVFFLFHFDAYTSSRNTIRSLNYYKSFIRSIFNFFKKYMSQTQKALCQKEVLCFSRDVTHTIQLLMLLGLCAIYIFNLRIFLNIDSFPSDTRDWWQKFFFVSNSSIAAFVTTGFCTRFVFISLSLEGKSFWILQNSPLSLKDIIVAKFSCWYFPVSILGSFVFCAAGLSLSVDWRVLLVSIAVSWIICYGIVGLAIGLGARFANFNWEHSSQLAAGFGNMVFMLASISLIAVNLVPICIILFINPYKLNFPFAPEINMILLSALMLSSIFFINYYVNKLAINSGVKVLQKSLENRL